MAYFNNPKFSDIYVRADSADSDQILQEQSDQVLHCQIFLLHIFCKKLFGLATLFEF